MQDQHAFNRLLDVLAAYKQTWRHYGKATNPEWGGNIPDLRLVIRDELCTIQQQGKDDWEDLFPPEPPEDILRRMASQMKEWESELQTLRIAKLPKLFTLADCKRNEEGWSLSADLTAILGVSEICCNASKTLGWKDYFYDLMMGTRFVPEDSPLMQVGFRDDGMIRFVHRDVSVVQQVLGHLNLLIVEQLTVSNPTQWAAAIGLDGRLIQLDAESEADWAALSGDWSDDLMDRLGVH